MAVNSYQHPITFSLSGNLAQDYKNAFEDYDLNLLPYLPSHKSARIIDVGCGWGQFLSWLRSKGYSQVEGVDMGAAQIEHCHSIGLDVQRASDSTRFLTQRSETYDMVTLHHVIEHLPPEPAIDLLRAIFESLRPGGTAIVQTPNMSAICAGVSRHVEMTHVNGFAETSLHEALLAANFNGIRVFGNTTPFHFAPKRVVWRLLQASSRLIWRMMLLSELGSDTPRILTKNLYAVAYKSNTPVESTTIEKDETDDTEIVGTSSASRY